MADLVTGETLRQRQLKQLAQRFPAANQNVAQGLQAANVIQQQQALGAAQPETAGIRAAQKAGAAQTGQAAQVAAGQAAQAQNQAVQVGQLGLAEQGREQRQQLAGQQMAMGQEQMNLEDSLDRMGRGMKNELYTKQMSFQRDQLGQARLNDRQLADWAIMKAKSQEELQDYAQTVNLAAARQEQLLKAAQAKVEQAIRQGYLSEKQRLDNNQRELLAKMKMEADKRQQQKMNKAKNKAAMWQAGGVILGAAAGAVIGTVVLPGVGTAAGAQAGAALGGGVGTMAGGVGQANNW